MGIDGLAPRPLGATGLHLTALSFGSAPLASVFWGNTEEQAVATAEAGVAAYIGLFDTSPFYGLGEAELRLGQALGARPRDDFLVATKAGRTLVVGEGGEPDVVFDFSRDAVRRQIEGSLTRLGLDRVDIVHVHDPEDHLDVAIGEAVPALMQLKAEGVVGAVSVGTNVCDTVLRFLADADPDVVMLAGRLTLLDQSARERVLPECRARRVPLLAAGVFNSGLLARPEAGSWFDYAPADAGLLARAQELDQRCREAGTTLRTAAMAYPLQFDEVASIVVGMAAPEEVLENLTVLQAGVPDGLWESLALPLGS